MPNRMIYSTHALHRKTPNCLPVWLVMGESSAINILHVLAADWHVSSGMGVASGICGNQCLGGGTLKCL